MTPRRIRLTGLVLLLTLSAATYGLAPGPEHPLAPSTTELRRDADTIAIAGGQAGFLTVWGRAELDQSYVTALDDRGQPRTAAGTPLPGYLFSPAVVWNRDAFVVAGYNVRHGGIVGARVTPDGQSASAFHLLASSEYPFDINVTANGDLLLLTWVTHSREQTLWGALLDRDFAVTRPTFAIAAREIEGIQYPRDHDDRSSIIAYGDGFLVAWENVTRPERADLLRVTRDPGPQVVATISAPSPVLQPALVNHGGSTVVLWHDGRNVHASRITGSHVSPAIAVVTSDGPVRGISVASDGAALSVAWRTDGSGSCYGMTRSILFEQMLDQSLTPLLAGRELDRGGEELGSARAAAASETVVIAWLGAECDRRAQVRSASSSTAEIRTISEATAPSVQRTPAVAVSGESILAIWSEQRDDITGAGVQGVRISEAGDPVGAAFAIADGPADLTGDTLSAGNGRFFVAWSTGSRIDGRFVREDGTLEGDVFPIASTAAHPFVVHDGSRFVVLWSENESIHTRYVHDSGLVTSGPSLAESGTIALGDATPGPEGEIGILYRVENAALVTLRTAVLHASWSRPAVGAAANRPCISNACPDYQPTAIGWNGDSYLALWTKSGGPGRGATLESWVPGTAPPRSVTAAYTTAVQRFEGRLAWTGGRYVFAYHMSGITGYYPATFATQLDSSGEPVDSYGIPLHDTRFPSLSRPDVVVTPSRRAVFVYAYAADPQSSRVYARSAPLTHTRRRTVGR